MVSPTMKRTAAWRNAGVEAKTLPYSEETRDLQYKLDGRHDTNLVGSIWWNKSGGATNS